MSLNEETRVHEQGKVHQGILLILDELEELGQMQTIIQPIKRGQTLLVEMAPTHKMITTTLVKTSTVTRKKMLKLFILLLVPAKTMINLVARQLAAIIITN